jgi:hypothetical protein
MNDQEILDQIDQMTDEQIDAVLADLHMLENFPDYATSSLKIQTTRGKIVDFELNLPQLILHEIIEDYVRPNRLVRLVALKARRMGFSTYFSGRFFQSTANQPNRYAIQITHEPDATDFLFKMVKRFYNLSPKDKRPETLYNNARLLEFNNKDGTGLNSAFRVATAGKDDVGSGQLIHYLHFSELAKAPQQNIDTLLTAITQCVPDIDDTAIVYESTARGIGGRFYDEFWNARYRIWVKKLNPDGSPQIVDELNTEAETDNIFTSIFLPWFCHTEYRMPVPPSFSLSEEELDVKERFGLKDTQLAWRRWTIANKCAGSVDTFRQEYPSTAREAFLGSGRPVFDTMRIDRLMHEAPKPQARYELFAGNWAANPVGRLKVWKEPEAGVPYVIGADVAEGLVAGDFSCADVVNHRTGEQVAQWHGNIDQDNIFEYADILAALGLRYNNALLAVERNNHGLGVVTQLYQQKYPNLYAEMVPDPPGRPRKRYGWVTSRATRPLIIDNLIQEVQEECTGIVCKETYDEMLSFKIQDNGRAEADHGCHDDRVLSIAIAKHVRQIVPIPVARRPRHIIEERKKRPRRKVSAKGWT